VSRGFCELLQMVLVLPDHPKAMKMDVNRFRTGDASVVQWADPF
jgi:hypothetical protein